MLLLILAYLGGVFTILSPRILSVLPFVFARSDQPFLKNGLPMLISMAITFALVAALAVLGGRWAVHANEYGRYVAMAVLAVLGLTLISARLARWITQPVAALGNKLSQRTAGEGGSVWGATGAALNGASVQTTLLLFTYAAGAATPLAVALLICGRVYALMKRSLGTGEWARRALGVLVLVGVTAIALGHDTGLLTRVSFASTAGIERTLVDAVRPAEATPRPQAGATLAATGLHVEGLHMEGMFPSLAGATSRLNSPPLTVQSLRGKVMLVDFWTYSCINCIRSLPYVEAWYAKYNDHGPVVIGVHSPEFAFEKIPSNVAHAVRRLGVDYPVALDSDYATWKGFNNQYWPADYFIDAKGRIRHHYYSEGDYKQSDVIRALLTAAGQKNLPGGYVDPDTKGVEAASSGDYARSLERNLRRLCPRR